MPPNTNTPKRFIDTSVSRTQKDIRSRFAFVAKARANVWLITGLILFTLGLITGVLAVVNPNPDNKYIKSLRQALALIAPRGTSSDTPPSNSSGTGTCARANPSATLDPTSGQGTVGQSASYTLTVTNNDANCPASNFDLQVGFVHSPGLRATLSSNSLSLVSGASGQAQVTISAPSPADNPPAQTGENNFSVTATSRVSAGYQAAANGIFNYLSSTSGCIKSTPSISLTPSTSPAVPAGGTTTFNYSVSNNNSTGCSPADFTLSFASPSDQNYLSPQADPSDISALPSGSTATGRVTVSVSAQAAASTPSFNSTVAQVGTSLNRVTTNFVNITGTNGCTFSTPLVQVTPEGAQTVNGVGLNFTVKVTNQDSAQCASSRFILYGTTGQPESSHWTNVSPIYFDLTHGNFSAQTVTVTPENATVGSHSYIFSVSHGSTSGDSFLCGLTGSAFATIQVSAGGTTGTQTPPSSSPPGCNVGDTVGGGVDSSGGIDVGNQIPPKGNDGGEIELPSNIPYTTPPFGGDNGNTDLDTLFQNQYQNQNSSFRDLWNSLIAPILNIDLRNLLK